MLSNCFIDLYILWWSFKLDNFHQFVMFKGLSRVLRNLNVCKLLIDLYLFNIFEKIGCHIAKFTEINWNGS